MHPLSLTGAAAKQRTPPQSTTAPPPSTTAAPSLPPSCDDARGGNAPKRVATQPAPSPSRPATLADYDLRLRLQQQRQGDQQTQFRQSHFPPQQRPTPSVNPGSSRPVVSDGRGGWGGGTPSRPSTNAQP